MERRRGKSKGAQTETSLAIDQALATPGATRESALGEMDSAIAALMAKHGPRAFQLDAKPENGRSYKVSGSAMEAVGIWDGDTVVVDDQRRGQDGDLVLVSRDGKRFEVRALRVEGDTAYLHAECSELSDEALSLNSSMTVYGVVTDFPKHS
jgi:Peptidase S24-like